MTTIHQKISELLVKSTSDSGHPLKSLLDGKSIQQVCHLVFMSYRENGGSSKGLRLSDSGLQLMRACFKSIDIPFTPQIYRREMPLAHILYLDRVSNMPYWVDRRLLCTFDSDLAMMLRLGDGLIQTLIDSRFRLVSSDNTLNSDK